ncbi:MAG: iron ABC transporter permease [Cytophagales bacterium]|nr:iron ABC transporter permease [Cytophagales bacterium]
MPERILEQYKQHLKRGVRFIASVSMILLTVVSVSIVVGSAEVGFVELYQLLTGKGTAFSAQIVYQIRLPRIIGGMLAGTALATSGAVVQSLLRNPLASPFTLGISGASAFGAAFAIIVLGAGSTYESSNDASAIDNPYLVTSSAFLWSILSVAVIILVSKLRDTLPETIVLAGIAVSTLFGAGISAMQYFADDIQLASIVFWTFGDLGRATWEYVMILGISLVPIMIFFHYQTWNYKSLRAGDEYAKSLGIKIDWVRLSGMLAASLATAIVVSFFGVIAFVGLVVPHIVRKMIGGDDPMTLPASAVFGGMFLVGSDTLARTVISPVMLPVGILTSFIGAPLFLFLLLKNTHKAYWS